MRTLFNKFLGVMLLLTATILITQTAINYANQIISTSTWHEKTADEYYNLFTERLQETVDFIKDGDSFNLQTLVEESFIDNRVQSVTITAPDGTVLASAQDKNIHNQEYEIEPDNKPIFSFTTFSSWETIYQISLNNTNLGTMTLLTLGPSRYNLTQEFFSKSINTFLISIPVSFIIALILSYVFSRRMAIIPIKLSKELNQLAKGDRDIDFSTSTVKEYNLISESAKGLQKELLRNQRSRSELLSNLGHDLRTPVTAMKVLVDGTIEGVFPLDLEIFRKINKQLTDLQHKSDAFLRIFELESIEFKLDYAECDILSLLNECVSIHHDQIEAGNMSIQLTQVEKTSDFIIQADRSLLKIVINNLITNMIQFSPAGSNGVISLNRQTDENIQLTFENPGKIDGLNPDALFDHATKDSYARSTPGAGLGLTIAREVVTKHAGTIEIANNEVNDAALVQVVVTLPIAPAS